MNLVGPIFHYRTIALSHRLLTSACCRQCGSLGISLALSSFTMSTCWMSKHRGIMVDENLDRLEDHFRYSCRKISRFPPRDGDSRI